MHRFGMVARLGKLQAFVECFHLGVGNFAVGQVQFFGLPKVVTAFPFAVFKRVCLLAEWSPAAEFRVAVVALVFQRIVQQVGRSRCKNGGGGFESSFLEVFREVLVDGLDDFQDFRARIEVFREDGPAKGGTLVRNEFAVYIASGNYRDNNTAFFHKERSVYKAPFGVVVQEFARLQKRPVHGLFHDKMVPPGFFFSAIGQYFVHIA